MNYASLNAVPGLSDHTASQSADWSSPLSASSAKRVNGNPTANLQLLFTASGATAEDVKVGLYLDLDGTKTFLTRVDLGDVTASASEKVTISGTDYYVADLQGMDTRGCHLMEPRVLGAISSGAVKSRLWAHGECSKVN